MRTGEKAIGTALQLAAQALSRLSNDLTPDLIHSLLVPFGHSVLIERRRAELILSRIRMVAVLFAILTPLWIGVDLTLFDWPLSGWLAMLRVLATVAFALLALWAQGSTLHRAWKAMGWMLA